MKYVLDSNIALKWVLAEPDSAKAKQLRDDFQKAVHELLAPDVFPIAVAHALTRAERQGKIAIGQAAVLWSDVLSTPPRLEPSGPITPRAIDISSQFRQGVYDCLYVALAERDNCELVTADDKLVRKLQSQFPFIVSLSSLP
ncbi:MAG TPA: type II toxin-antitoxin system VapC family toxin [Gemmataceae bacterium]|nr:type II toxin-antitoxin system VapC family toxin [Gemmataceae bacterium]